MKTPRQAEGPFYPINPIPLRNNLIYDATALKQDSMHLQGRIVDQKGQPIIGARIEIWQCDRNGLYDHPAQSNHASFDRNFAGFGATLTDQQGVFQFETSYPYPYPGRQPHIHVKLWQGETQLLTTQIYLKGKTKTNEWFDVGREHLQIDPSRDQKAEGQWAASFQFVV